MRPGTGKFFAISLALMCGVAVGMALMWRLTSAPHAPAKVACAPEQTGCAPGTKVDRPAPAFSAPVTSENF